MRSILFVFLLLSLDASATVYDLLLPQQSSVVFIAQQMGVTAEGNFGRFKAELAIDPENAVSGKAKIYIDIASIDLGDADAYAEVVGASWFDSVRYPVASFISSKVTRLTSNSYEVSGKMTIRDVTRDVKAAFTLKQQASSITIDGMFPLNRLDYGIGSGMWGDTDTVANEVKIRFHFTVTRRK